MKNILSAVAVLTALTAFCSCGGGGGNDPLGTQDTGTGDFGGQLTRGTQGSNLAVTEDDKYPFSQYIINQVYQVYARSLNVLANLSVSDTLRSVRQNGNYFGYAVAALTSDVANSGSSINLGMSITFYDYSDSGSVYTGGNVDCSSTATENNGIWVPKTLFFNRGMLFAGAYRGSIVFSDQEIILDSQGRMFSVYATAKEMSLTRRPGVTLTISSADSTLVFNPYYRLVLPPDTSGAPGGHYPDNTSL